MNHLALLAGLVPALFIATTQIPGLLAAQAPAPSLKDSPINIEILDVPEIPLKIDRVELLEINGEHALKCSVANVSDDQTLGLRLVLVSADPSAKRRSRASWMEVLRLDGHSAREVIFRPVAKLKIKPGDRAALTVDQVIGREYIWQAFKAETALEAFVAGVPPEMPAVRRVSNQLDSDRPILLPRRRP
jgi:hypothetical protein